MADRNTKFGLVKNGNLKPTYQFLFGGIGIVLILLPALITMNYEWKIISISVGAVVGAIGGYAAKAHVLRIIPFDNSYQEARRSYDDDVAEEKKINHL